MFLDLDTTVEMVTHLGTTRKGSEARDPFCNKLG
jgi:hypothetical protein